jgi:hypothetical protein
MHNSFSCNKISYQTERLHLDGLTALPVPEHRGITLLRNVGKNMPKDTTPHPTRRILTFKNFASYIQDRRTATLQMLHFIYFFSTNVSTEYFKYAAHSLFFSSKCRLFHNATFFGSCIIHILRTGCAKI